MVRLWLILFSLILTCQGAYAHSVSTAYLQYRSDSTLQYDISLRDLDLALAASNTPEVRGRGLDRDGDFAITVDELQQGEPFAVQLFMSSIRVRALDQTCELSVVDSVKTVERLQGLYARFTFKINCPVNQQASDLEYLLFFEIDPSHRIIFSKNSGSQAILTSESRALSIAKDLTLGEQLKNFLMLGVDHILTGYDHLLFVLTLIFPALAYPSLKKGLLEIVQLVTTFTIAHSITLILAALSIIQVSAHLVEPTIALSIAFAAFNNIFPLVTRWRWIIVFIFGLIHGLGFASALLEDHQLSTYAILSVAAFNIGVELGQLGVVAICVPVLLLLRKSRKIYELIALKGLSVGIFLVAVWWFIERIL